MHAQSNNKILTENKDAIVASAQALYDSKLPYHNFEHVQDVLAASDVLLKKCQEEQIDVDADVVFFAILFHDSGYEKNNKEMGFATKEAYSAYLAETVLAEYGISQSFIDKVKQAINSTHQDVACQTNEDKVVKNSDLMGLTYEYPIFKENSLRLLEEYNLMNDKDMQWDEWAIIATKRLEKYLDPSIFLTSDYFNEDGECWFIESTRDNLKKMQAETATA